MIDEPPRKDLPEDQATQQVAPREYSVRNSIRRLSRTLGELNVIAIMGVALFGAGFSARGFYDEWRESRYANCPKGSIEVPVNSVVPDLSNGVTVTLLAVQEPGKADFLVSDSKATARMAFGKKSGDTINYVIQSGKEETLTIAYAVVGSEGYVCLKP